MINHYDLVLDFDDFFLNLFILGGSDLLAVGYFILLRMPSFLSRKIIVQLDLRFCGA